MKNVLLLFVLTCFVFPQCNRNKNSYSTAVLKINDLTVNDIKKDSSIIEDVQYLKLEVNESCMIGKVDKILYRNDKYYIFDKDITKSIFVFRNDGKFLFKISKWGKGPGEYILPLDFDVDRSGNIYVYDNVRKNILRYGPDGDFPERSDLSFSFEEFVLSAKDKIIVRNLYENGKIIASLGDMDLKTGKIDILMPVKKGAYDDLGLPRFSSHYLFRSDNTVYYYPGFSNKVLKIKDGKIIDAVIFNSSLFPPDDFVEEIKKDPDVILRNDKYITDIRDIYENGDLLIMKIQKGFLGYNMIISNTTEAHLIIPELDNEDYFGENRVWGVAKSRFIGFVFPDDVNDKWRAKVKSSGLAPQDKQLLLNINNSSNPVICLIKFRKFE